MCTKITPLCLYCAQTRYKLSCILALMSSTLAIRPASFVGPLTHAYRSVTCHQTCYNSQIGNNDLFTYRYFCFTWPHTIHSSQLGPHHDLHVVIMYVTGPCDSTYLQISWHKVIVKEKQITVKLFYKHVLIWKLLVCYEVICFFTDKPCDQNFIRSFNHQCLVAILLSYPK